MKNITLILFLFTTFSCTAAKVQQRKDAKHFPTRPEIVELMKKKQGDILEDKTPGKIVDTWELKAPLPTMIGETIASPKNPVEGALAEAIEKLPDVRMTDSMNCVAHQNAAFLAVYKKAPFDSLKRFINARCGSVTKSSRTYTIALPKAASRDLILQKTKRFIYKNETGRNWNIGVYLAEGDTKATLVFAIETSSFYVKPIPMQAEEGGLFRFEGTYNGKDIERFSASFNVGEFGFGDCERQPVDPPAFSFICKTNPKDKFSYVEVGSSEKDAMYENIRSSFMIFPNEPTHIYEPPTSRRILHAAEIKKKDGNLTYIEELINRVRNSGGRRAIKLEGAQSQIIQRLTPAYVNASDSLEEKNKILLSMLAGWEISSEIIGTSFRYGYIDGSNAISMLESVLESPGGRETLLAKNVSSFGIGVVSRPKRGTFYMFVSYDFLQNEHMNKRISRVMKSLRKERKIRGFSAPKELTQYRTHATQWAKEFREGATFETIRKKMVTTFRYNYISNKTLWHYGYTISDLDEVRFSDHTLNVSNLKIMIFVTPYRPKNSPRTFFAIFYVYEGS